MAIALKTGRYCHYLYLGKGARGFSISFLSPAYSKESPFARLH